MVVSLGILLMSIDFKIVSSQWQCGIVPVDSLSRDSSVLLLGIWHQPLLSWLYFHILYTLFFWCISSDFTASDRNSPDLVFAADWPGLSPPAFGQEGLSEVLASPQLQQSLSALTQAVHSDQLPVPGERTMSALASPGTPGGTGRKERTREAGSRPKRPPSK